MNKIKEYLGNGIYSLSDASFITGISSRSINRWVKGYKRQDKEYDPLISIDYAPIEDFYSISFLDLMELYFVKEFRKYNVPLKTIRIAYNKAREIIQFDHPFSTMKFKTDGKHILADIPDIDDEAFLNLVKSQFSFKKVLEPFLKSVDFEEDIIHRYWPLGKDRQIVLDPHRSFGKPIVNKEGVTAEVLFNAYKAEDSIERVVSWFEVSNESVKDAVEYYQQKLAA